MVGLAACALVVPSRLVAQSTFATLNGIVTDQSGALMPGVTVTITKEATGATRSVTTDGAGRYQFVNVDAGPYRLTARLEGFAEQAKEVELLARQIVKSDLQLQVAGTAETVQVSVVTPVIETERPTIDRSRVGRGHQQAGPQLPRHQQHQPDRRRDAGPGGATGP